MTKRTPPAAGRGDGTADVGFIDRIDVAFLIHELKDPLSVIETALRMLLEKADKYGPLTPRQTKTLQRALRNSKKARAMLGDLLEVGRSDAGHFECRLFDPVGVVDEVLMEVVEACDADLWEALLADDPASERAAVLSRRGICFTCTDGVRGVRICQDETKFRQIVGNLLKNAFQHRRRQIEILMDCREDQLIVNVIDDGPGVEKDNRELIFERYTRIKAGGALTRPGHGLGLAGARMLARHLGGDITVRDHRSTGAMFCLRLPLTLAGETG